MKLIFTFAILAAAAVAIAADPLPAAKLAQAREEWQAKRKELDEVYITYLNNLKVEQTKAGNLEEAIALDQEIKRLEVEFAAPAEPKGLRSIVGTWDVTYSNGSIRVMNISANGVMNNFDPVRNVNYRGKVTYKNGEAICDWDGGDKGRIYRLQNVNGCLFIETWLKPDTTQVPHRLATGLRKKR